MSAPKTQTPPTKTAFVLGFSASTPARTIIEKGKAIGLTIAKGYVYEIRSAKKRAEKAKGKTPVAKPVAPKGTKPKVAPKAKAPTAPSAKPAVAATKPSASLSKAAFIRSLGTAPAKQVVIEGKKRGLSFTETYVYNVRGSGKSKRSRGAKPAPLAAAKLVTGGDDATFRRLVLELGIGRARALLADVERRLADLVAGL